jgi:hypothetical protein
MSSNENDLLMRAFDLVAATRERRGLRTIFNPLAADKVTQLKDLLAQALETEAAQDVSFREVMLSASGAIERYEAEPAIVRRSVPSEVYIFRRVDQEVPNPEKPRILSRMQRQLYRGLKPRVT